jgi:hypothetical protein
LGRHNMFMSIVDIVSRETSVFLLTKNDPGKNLSIPEKICLSRKKSVHVQAATYVPSLN